MVTNRDVMKKIFADELRYIADRLEHGYVDSESELISFGCDGPDTNHVTFSAGKVTFTVQIKKEIMPSTTAATVSTDSFIIGDNQLTSHRIRKNW